MNCETTTMHTPLDDANELCRLSAAQLVAHYRKAEISPVEVVTDVLARAEVVQRDLNAFTLIDHDGAIAAARESEARWRAGVPCGPLDGVPTTIKDIVWAKGWTVHFGSRTSAITPTEDAPSVALLRSAGAVLIGQTTTPEFGWKAITDSPFSGITRNPWDPARTPGGSSGGAAVAAATGVGPLHLGTDGGGSVRIPAAFTGTVGHKPTSGRIPVHPAGVYGTLATVGPMARTVADAALMLDVMSAPNFHMSTQAGTTGKVAQIEHLRGARIGVLSTPPCGKVAPEVQSAFGHFLRALNRAGASLETIHLPDEDLLDLFHILWFSGVASRVQSLPEIDRLKIDPGLRYIAEIGAGFRATDYVMANLRQAAFGAAFEAMLRPYDFAVSPAVSITAFGVGLETPPDTSLVRWTEWAGFSFPINLAQAPATVLPCGFSEIGMPIGLQIFGRRNADGAVLAAAAACASLIGNRDAM